MELLEIIKKRRSIRNFSPQPVEDEKVKMLIEAATCAPTSCNLQAWKFIIINNVKVKEKIVEAGGTILIKKPPLGILVVYNNQTSNFEYHDDIQSAAAAIQNILLMATSLGLGCCWICHLPNKKTLRKIFKIPANYSPIAYLLLGYPAKKPLTVPKKNQITELISYNQFNNKWVNNKISYSKLLIKKIMIKIYYSLPLIIKKSFLNKLIDKYFVKKFDN